MAAFSVCRFCRSFISTTASLRAPAAESFVKTQSHIKSLTRIGTSYQINPERLKKIEESPSGWVPPATNQPNLPFYIKRSKFNNLPVYTDYKGGRTLKITVIRKIKGDLKALDDCLRHFLGDDIITQINELTSQVKIKGIYKDDVMKVLKQLGF